MTRTRFSLGLRLKYFWLPLVIAIWTILQSMAHAWWVVYGRGMLACEMQVKRKLEFYLYMTYLYSNDCDDHALKTYAQVKFHRAPNDSANVTRMFPIPPLYKDDGTMTESLMHLYLASDAAWIVASVGLLIGVLMRLKQGSALIFYLPWILASIVILAMDLFSTVYFGLQLPSAEVIIQPLSTFKLDKSTIMAITSGRLGFIWLLNVFNVVVIIWYTRASYNQRYCDERIRRKPKMHRQDTESRIKNWQLFYGDIYDSAANAHQASGDKSSFALEEDLNYTTTFKELEDYNHKQELCSTFKSSSSVSTGQTTATAQSNLHCQVEPKKKVQIRELVSHLPWSYIESNKNFAPTCKIKDNAADELDSNSKKVAVLESAKNVTNCFADSEQVSRF